MHRPPTRSRQGVIHALVFAASTPSAQELHFEPSISIGETLTNNVDLGSSNGARGDLITQVTPGFTVLEKGARTTLTGTVSLPMLLYVRTGAENNKVLPQANLLGSVEVLDKFFFIDGAASVSQQYLNPFGPRPPDLTNATDNRYTAQSYSVSPYVKGLTGGGLAYEVRDISSWTILNRTPVEVNGAYSNDLTATIAKSPTPLGWAAEFDRASVKFSSQPPLLTQLARLRAIDAPDPQLELSASGGYEDDDYTVVKFRNPIYGLGATWHPNERTTITGNWEHRFFGTSYLFDFNNRTPLMAWNLHASRNISTYPQQLAQLPPGFDTLGILNLLFLSLIPDPVQRLAFINQFIRDRGLPAFLSSPINIYTQQITLQQQASATVGLLGARNSIFMSVFYLRSEPIAPSGDPLSALLGIPNKYTQEGVNAVWSHNLTSAATLVVNAFAYRTNSDVSQAGRTKQASLTATVNAPLSANTSTYAGARYQRLLSDIGNSYSEAAVFVGVSHTFR